MDLMDQYGDMLGKQVTLKDIVNAVEFEEFWNSMVELYPNDNGSKESYELVYQKLRVMPSVPNTEDMYIIISECYEECQLCVKSIRYKDLCAEPCDDKGDLYYDVSGWKESNPNVSYGIEFTPWNEWLGFYLNKTTLQNYTKPQILAHTLYEMTFCGYDESDIKEQIDEISRRIEEVENGTAKLIPLSEVMEHLKLEDE